MKRILCSALALVLALSLCACGESGGDTGPTYPAAFAGLEDQIDAAREEGRLTVCVSGDEPFLTAACPTAAARTCGTAAMRPCAAPCPKAAG